MPIQPVRDLLYIIPLNRPERVGSIILPDSHEPRTNQGIVKYRGPGTSGEIKVGDHVYFSGYDGDEIVFEDEGRLILLPEGAVDAVDGGPTEPDAVIMTVANFKILLDRVVGRLAVRIKPEGPVIVLKSADEKAAYIHLVADRLKEELDGILAQEMHF